MNVGFCGCEPDVVSLVKLRYWPATPSRPSIAFAFSMLDWLEALLLECQVPIQDFVYAVEFLLKSRCRKVRSQTDYMDNIYCAIYILPLDAL